MPPQWSTAPVSNGSAMHWPSTYGQHLQCVRGVHRGARARQAPTLTWTGSVHWAKGAGALCTKVLPGLLGGPRVRVKACRKAGGWLVRVVPRLVIAKPLDLHTHARGACVLAGGRGKARVTLLALCTRP